MMRQSGSRKKKSARVTAPAPAPGDLEIVQALLNTVDFRASSDELAHPPELRDWLVGRGLLRADAELTRSQVGRAHDVRNGVRALLEAHYGARLDKEAVRRLDRAIQGACAQIRFLGDGSDHFEPGDFDAALGHLAALVVVTRRAGLWKRFKVCADPECRAAFYDFASSLTTRWCTRRCGDRVRAKSYRRGATYKATTHRSPPRVPKALLKYAEPLDDTDEAIWRSS